MCGQNPYVCGEFMRFWWYKICFFWSTDYIDDICPYATFQLPEKPPGRPVLTTATGGALVAGLGGMGIGLGGTGGSGSGGGSSGASSAGSTTAGGKGPIIGTKSGGGNKRFGRHTGDTMYSVGNIYSGPYHSVQSPGFLYNSATLQLRVSMVYFYCMQ